MDIDSLHQRFELWKRILFINIGASITLVATGIADLPNLSGPYFPGWYGVWFVIQLACLLPGFVLLWGKHWMQIPLRDRLNTILGYFAVTWVAALSAAIRMGLNLAELARFFLIGWVIIALGYGWLRRKSIKADTEIFP